MATGQCVESALPVTLMLHCHHHVALEAQQILWFACATPDTLGTGQHASPALLALQTLTLHLHATRVPISFAAAKLAFMDLEKSALPVQQELTHR